jgi:hypothetical protein
MSKREEKCWSLWCDWPGCEFQFEYGDYTIFGNGYDPDEIASESDGWVGVDGSHYCHNHLTAWASDYEDGEPFPGTPFLLIHDGDTDNSDDDGRVTLRDGAAS